MRANDLVKEHGWEYAKGIVIACESGFLPKNQNYEDLKRLVESHEYIESYGGLNESKRTFEMRHGVINLDGWDKLKQAIADVESCQ